jgi:carbon dioxide concentrating mechanism protein CcmO
MPAAMGFVETRGFTGMIEATDAMNKAARVEFVRQEQIGGGHVTTIVTGDVGAVRASVDGGANAAKAVGDLHAVNVIPNLHAQVDRIVLRWEAPEEEIRPSDSLGLIEMHGFTPMVEAADAAVKAARVVLTDYVFVGSGYCAAIVRGDVAACRTAVDAGQASGGRVGPVITPHVIARPHPMLFSVLPLGPRADAKEDVSGKALGIIETKGFVASVEAADRALKTARVALVSWQKVGSAFSAVVVQGDVAAVRSAVDAGAAAAGAIGKLVFTHVIPRPHEAVDQVLPLPKRR